MLCWGDARLGNIIFKPSLDAIAAVLDWEMAVLGNPVQDLAWFNYLDATFSEGLGMPRLEGLPSYEHTIARWEKASGFSAQDYGYYQIFAGMRYGLILSRIMLALKRSAPEGDGVRTLIFDEVHQGRANLTFCLVQCFQGLPVGQFYVRAHVLRRLICR